MSRIERSLERLTSALAEIEDRLGPATGAAERSHAMVEELAALKAEREALREALAQAQADNDALQDFTDDVAGRLDGAIREIRAVLQS